AHRKSGSTFFQRSHRVSQLHKHRDFSMRHFRNDITLLKLATPVRLSPQVSPVCLPSSGSRIPAGTRCYITGWGRTRGGGQSADILQQAILPVANDQTCRSRNSHIIPVDTNSMICAGGQGQNAPGGCQGDSGGPFVCRENNKWVLRGAVSWGHRMCDTRYFTVFARISAHMNWIIPILKG
ncbi:hypothetical protein QZH41_012450, partial [Actinostola sp. cb2023]